ncbi:MAG TPA: exonuclease domain-containing protein [Acidimicrobiales bacterium]|nr:exonuclease domain-containing protein [Acidimicrobiales bacterium]
MEIAVQRSFDDLDTPLSQVTFVVIDVETTGGSPTTCSLTEVAAARYRGGELLGTYQTFVRPDERIPPFITALTGISDATVADAPRVGAMLPSFLEFVGRSVLVGHNLRFDLSFLDHALISTGRDRLTNATVDTLALARRLIRDMVPNCKLGTLAATLHLPHQPSHRALTDVLATGDLLHALLERAGSFGILGLSELLDLPRLVGHPQGAKLRLTVRLPHRPGVYWFTDSAGQVLYVGKATDLQARVRSYFSGDKRRHVGRLLRQLHHVHHRECPGPFSAAVAEGRMIRTLSPPFNSQGKVRRTGAAGATRPRSRPPTTRSSTRRRRRPTWSPEELAGDPTALLGPLAVAVCELSDQQRYEEAAIARDEAERLRQLLVGHRRVESLRAGGRVTLSIEGEGVVQLDRGVVADSGVLFDTAERPSPRPPNDDRYRSAMAADGHDNERTIVAQWLAAHADRVTIIDVESPGGLSMPAVRVPTLSELCGPRAGLDPAEATDHDDRCSSAA